MKPRLGPKGYWREAFLFRLVFRPSVIIFLLILAAYSALVVYLYDSAHVLTEHDDDQSVLEQLVQVLGTVLGLLIALRLNATFQRWWEARTLWGGIINQSRNIAIAACGYGPPDPHWRDRVVRWTIAFAHATRGELRYQRKLDELIPILGSAETEKVQASNHMPTYTCKQLASLFRQALDSGQLNEMAFRQLESERGRLIDYVGGCERIRNTPLNRPFVIAVRQFVLLTLAASPFTFYSLVDTTWLIPLMMAAIGYPLILLDEIGAELENPFDPESLGHLPLENYTTTISENLRCELSGVLGDEPSALQPLALPS